MTDYQDDPFPDTSSRHWKACHAVLMRDHHGTVHRFASDGWDRAVAYVPPHYPGANLGPAGHTARYHRCSRPR